MNLKDMSLNDICEDLIEAGRYYAQYNPEDFHVWCEIMGTRKAELLRRFGELQKQVEDMKCCGNCIHYTCEEDGQWRCENGFCDDKPSDTCKNWKQ